MMRPLSKKGLARRSVWVVLTSNTRLADMPGNVLLSQRATGLSKVFVANVSQIVTVDRGALEARTGRLPRAKLQLVLGAIDVMLGR